MIPLILVGAAYLIGKTMEGKYYSNGGIVPLLAPNGKPSNLNEVQWHLVRTPKFKAWFGDWENDAENASKVVDENGEPLVVYRGFNSKSNRGNIFKYGVNRFKHNRLANRFAHYFTRSKKVAYEYATQGEMVSENDIIIKEYFLRCNNLLDITTSNPKFPKFEYWVKSREALFSYSPYDVVEKLKNRQIPLNSYLFESVINDNNENDINKLSELKIKELQKRIAKEEKIQKEIYTDSQELNLYHLVKMISGKELNEIFKEQYNEHEAEGRRGIYNWFIHFKPNDVIVFDDLDIFLKDLIIENNYQGGKFLEFQFGAKTKKDKEVYFVFESTQIKLADGTNTTFDSNNPDIRYDEGGNIKQKEEDIFKDIFSYKYNGFYSGFKESELQSIIDFLLGVMLRTNSGLGEGIGKKTLRNLFFKTPQSFRELYEVKPSRNLWRGDTIFPTKKNRKSDFYLQSYSNKSMASFFGSVIYPSTAIESYGGSFSTSKYNDTLKSTDYWFLKAATFYLMSKKNKEMYSELFTMQQFFSIFYILNGKGLIGRKYQNWLNKKWLRGKGINFNVDEYKYGNEIEIGDDEGEVMFFDVIYNYPLLKSIEKKYS